jgi:hypothetical protein
MASPAPVPNAGQIDDYFNKQTQNAVQAETTQELTQAEAAAQEAGSEMEAEGEAEAEAMDIAIADEGE